MRRVRFLLTAVLLACANIGCLAVVATETVATSGKRVAVLDGEVYIIDLSDSTATRVRMVEADEPIAETDIEVKSETATPVVVDGAKP